MIAINYWVNEDFRNEGISEVYIDDFKNAFDAIDFAIDMVRKHDIACAEVEENGTVLYGIDEIDEWGVLA